MSPTVNVPESHRDLLVRPIHAILATMLPSGFPQAHVVWCDFDGSYVHGRGVWRENAAG